MRNDAVHVGRRAIPRKSSVLCMVALLAAANTSAAGVAVKYWATALTHGVTEGAFSVQETLDRGAVVAGWPSGPDAYADRPRTMLVRLTASGTVKWQETLAAPLYGGDEYLYRARQTSDGGFIAVGRAGPDWYAAAVLKLNRAGKIIWKTYLNGGSAWARDVLLTGDGGCVVLAGIEYRDLEPPDLYLIKLDRDGAVEWQRRYGNRPQSEWASSILQTSDGGYFITALSYLWYPLLVRLDSTGAIMWSKYVPFYVWLDDVVSACETGDGGYLISFNDRNEMLGDDTDIYLMRLDSSGNAVWQKNFGSEYPDLVRQVIRTRDGDFVAVGITKKKASYSDAFLMKLDPSGTIIWQRTYGSPVGPESGNSVCETKDGGFLIAGNSRSFGSGDSDIWVLRLDKDGLLGGSSCDLIGTAELRPSATKLKLKGYKASVFGVNSVPGTLEWAATATQLTAAQPCSAAAEGAGR